MDDIQDPNDLSFRAGDIIDLIEDKIRTGGQVGAIGRREHFLPHMWRNWRG